MEPQALGGREQVDIEMLGDLDLSHHDIRQLFSPDIVELGIVRFNGRQLYYAEQAADFVPFKSGQAASYIPPELLDKTNQQILDSYGLALGGAIAPADAVTDERLDGLIGDTVEYLPHLQIKSRSYTSQLNDCRLRFRDTQHRLVKEDQGTLLLHKSRPVGIKSRIDAG